MRVMVFMNSLNTGGAEFSTLSFYQWLRQKGHMVSLVCLKQASSSFNPVQFGFDQVSYLKGNSFRQHVRSLNRLIDDFKPQLIHSVLYDANMVARFCRMFYRNFIHLESLVNEMYSPYRLTDPNVTWFKLKVYQTIDWMTHWFGVDHFHATGNSVAVHYQNVLGIKPQRITVINRGRAVNPFIEGGELNARLNSEYKNKGVEVILIMVARHEFQKGHDVLIRALSQLKTTTPWVCLLAGRNGNLTASIVGDIKNFNLDDKVKILGHRDDIPELLSMSDVFVFPSRFEGLPGALIEAEAAGLPVVCTDIPNNMEVVKESLNALVFPVDNANLLSNHLTFLIENQSQRERMGKESLRIFKENFEASVSHNRMMELLTKLVSEK